MFFSMALRFPEPTAAERRSRRIRSVWAVASLAAIVGALVLLAYLGVTIQHRTLPRQLQAEAPADGQFLFRAETMLESASAQALAKTPSAPTTLLGELRDLLPSLHPSGQILYWKATTDRQAQWLVFLPFRKPNRLYMDRFRSVFKDVDLFSPVGSRREGTVAYFDVNRQGLFLSSTHELPKFQTLAGFPKYDGDFDYQSANGYLPDAVARDFDVQNALACTRLRQLHMSWSVFRLTRSGKLTVTGKFPDLATGREEDVELELPFVEPFFGMKEPKAP